MALKPPRAIHYEVKEGGSAAFFACPGLTEGCGPGTQICLTGFASAWAEMTGKNSFRKSDFLPKIIGKRKIPEVEPGHKIVKAMVTCGGHDCCLISS